MTTPDAPDDAHLKRPRLARQRANRAQSASETTDPGGESAAGSSKPDRPLADTIAEAVKTSYDVLSENMRQGRNAAERFQGGRYAMSSAPDDLQGVALRLIRLARELSGVTLDICERLLREAAQAAGAPAAASTSETPPPFRSAKAKPQPSPVAVAPPAGPAPSAAGLRLAVTFEGAADAVSRTATLQRPTKPTAPGAISAAPLASRDGGAPITAVSFDADLSAGGLVATVKIPDGQAPGVYSGLVYAGDDPIPLGVLSIELRG